MIYTAYIKPGQYWSDIHERVTKWIEKYPGSFYNKPGGVTYLNGKMFYNNICFINEEDKTAFLITFGNLVTG